MLKTPVRVAISTAVLLLGLGLGVTLGTIIYAVHTPPRPLPKTSVTTLPPALITMPRAQDLFEPFILPVALHETVTWRNDDTVTHSFTTTPDASNFLNPQSFSFHVAAGKSITFTFTHPGLYHYYEKTLGTWNTTFSRVVANKGVPRYPLAMDGIIWVQGNISGLPAAALNHVPLNHDEFAYEFIAIRQSSSVIWHNFDTDPHFIGFAAGWNAPINPIDPGLFRLPGTDAQPGGGSVTVTFDTPGLYYYYCRNHDHFDPSTYRALVLTKASEFPLPMEGFVLVLSNS